MRPVAIAVVIVVCAVGAAAEPPPPTLVFPSERGVIGHLEPAARAITPFVWTAVPGAVRYRMMLGLGATFEKPLKDSTVAETTQVLTGLDVGRYYWRVAAIDSQGVQGAFSERSSFRVEQVSADPAPSRGVGPAPALVYDLQVRSGRTLSVKGKTEPGARVTLNGQPCAVEPDGTFNEFVSVREPGLQEVVIRATAQGGGVTEMWVRDDPATLATI